MTSYAMGSAYWPKKRPYNNKGYRYSKGRGYQWKGFYKGNKSKGATTIAKGKGGFPPPKKPSPPVVFSATPPPHGECFVDTGENGVCDRNCDFALAGSDLCSQGQSCCVRCNQNDANTECCLSSDCRVDHACRYNQCICAHECCSINDCGDAMRYQCVNNQCQRRDCDVFQTNAECCVDVDCPIGHVCEESVCIVQGGLRFTLTWYGDGKNGARLSSLFSTRRMITYILTSCRSFLYPYTKH